MLAAVLLGLLVTGIVTAAPAAAVDDPTRPDARVTHGPSCRPGGLVVEVVAGTSPYFVRLATTRLPGGEDEATVVPGTTVVLRTGDVDWGETIDGRLEFEARDGSGVTFVDELDVYSFTRPSSEDCSAVGDPTQPHPSPPSDAAGKGGGTGILPVGRDGAGAAAWASDRQVAPGQTVALDGAGFLAGERVAVQLAGGAVLASTTAAADGTVRTEVRIPEGAAAGPCTVTLVGDDSAVVAHIDLRVAPPSATVLGGVPGAVPLLAAAAALGAAALGLVSAAARRRAVAGPRRGATDRGPVLSGSA